MSEAEKMDDEYISKACDIFTYFLGRLETMLKKIALVQSTEISVLYVQKPVKLKKGLFSRGLVRIGRLEWPFEAGFDLESEIILIESPVFFIRFRLPLRKLEEILKESKENGEINLSSE